MGVSITEIIHAPIDSIWGFVSDFGGLRRWHPLVERCEAEGAGEGALRTVHFADWWATERLDRLDANAHVFGYTVIDSNRPPTIGVSGTVKLTALDDGITRVDWTSGLPLENPNAVAVNAGLEAYYPVRIGHLKAALGIHAK